MKQSLPGISNEELLYLLKVLGVSSDASIPSIPNPTQVPLMHTMEEMPMLGTVPTPPVVYQNFGELHVTFNQHFHT